MDFCLLICIILLTLIFPPLGVLIVVGCGPDLLVNILFCLLGYFPGHIHAFYLIFVAYDRQDKRRKGIPMYGDAFGIFSRRVQEGY